MSSPLMPSIFCRNTNTTNSHPIQTIEYRTRPGRNSELNHTVLLIGDGTAEGFGDSPGNTGLASRINALIRENQELNGLRLRWHVVTAGRLFTKSQDWLPSPESSSGGLSATLFQNAIVKGPFRDADVVVVFLGQHDAHENLSDTTRNIRLIAEGIVRLGKYAIVSAIPNYHPPKSQEAADVRAANQALGKEIAKLELQKGIVKGRLHFDIDPMKVTVHGSDVLSVEDGFYSFNSRGYRMLARDVYDGLVGVAKKVEWVYWKKRLEES